MFDKPGTVVIGCNIHDQMVAYIQVVNTPYFGISSEAGKARISNLPAGKDRLKTWHYQMAPGAVLPEQEFNVNKDDMAVAITLNMKFEAAER